MAVNKWESTSSTDYSVAANWSAGTVPAAGEDVVILSGTDDITEGLDQSAVEMNGFEVQPGDNGPIGSR